MKTLSPSRAATAATSSADTRNTERSGVFDRKPKFVMDALERAGVSRTDVDSAFEAGDLDFLVSKESAVATAPVEGRPGPAKAGSGQVQTGFAAAAASTVTAPVEGRPGPAKSGGGQFPTGFAAAAAKNAAAKTITLAEFERMSHPERNRFMREGGHLVG